MNVRYCGDNCWETDWRINAENGLGMEGKVCFELIPNDPGVGRPESTRIDRCFVLTVTLNKILVKHFNKFEVASELLGDHVKNQFRDEIQSAVDDAVQQIREARHAS